MTTPPAVQDLELRDALGQLVAARQVAVGVQVVELDHLGIDGLVRLEQLHDAIAQLDRADAAAEDHRERHRLLEAHELVDRHR